MKKNEFEKTIKASGRLTAIIVAAVFAMEMFFVPMDSYAAETDEVEALPQVSGELNDAEYDGFIYKIKEDTTASEIKEMEDAINELDEGRKVEEVVKDELYAADSLESIYEVVPEDQVEYIEPDYVVRAMGTDDPYYEKYGWYLEMIKAPYIWERGVFGSGVTVAVLDSGIKADHQDFEFTDIKSGYNAINESQDVTDDAGHGTGVTGVIAASMDNGKGLTGIMPDISVLPVKFMKRKWNPDTGEYETVGSLSGLVRSINYAKNHGADVINVSAGMVVDAESLREACQSAAHEGAIIVAASGNEYDSSLEYPACYSCVISVGSIESDGESHSDFSNYNSQVMIVAPGRGILTPGIGGGYRSVTGTSFSTPQVSAMAAMVKAMDRRLGVTGFKAIIKATAIDKGQKGRDDYFGYGLMDLSRAYRYMEGCIGMYTANLSYTKCVFSGQNRTPSVTVEKAARVLPDTYYEATYPAKRKDVGAYTVTVKGKGQYADTGTIKLKYLIMPPLVTKIAAPVAYYNTIKVKWNAMSKSQKEKYGSAITGYQARVSTSSSFKNAKDVKVTGVSKTSVYVKGLKRKTTYYVQYRTNKVVGSTIYCSKWSDTKKITTK